MTTARQIVRKAMQKAGILTKTEDPSADEASDALDALNNMLSSWSNDSLLIYARSWETFNLSGGVGEYTIGTGQTFNTSRPVFIPSAYVRQAQTDYNLSIVSDEVYNDYIMQKSTPGLPQFLSYDNGFPVGRIRVWPVPSTSYQLFLLMEKQLTQFALDDDAQLPPGWERALIYNLAVELAPEYGQQVDAVTVEIAERSRANIQRSIAKARSMDAQPMGVYGFNIYTGYYR